MFGLFLPTGETPEHQRYNIQTYTHLHAKRACTHARTHTHTHIHNYMHTHTYRHTYIHTYIHTRGVGTYILVMFSVCGLGAPNS